MVSSIEAFIMPANEIPPSLRLLYSLARLDMSSKIIFLSSVFTYLIKLINIDPGYSNIFLSLLKAQADYDFVLTKLCSRL